MVIMPACNATRSFGSESETDGFSKGAPTTTCSI